MKVVVTVPEVGSVVAWPVYSSVFVLVYVMPLLVTVTVLVMEEAAETVPAHTARRVGIENFIVVGVEEESVMKSATFGDGSSHLNS